MKWLIIGHGIQGKKRKKLLGDACIGILDPFVEDSEFKHISDIKEAYDFVAICTKQDSKLEYLRKFSSLGTPILVEKPFPHLSANDLSFLNENLIKNNSFVYTAYNHRFEPSVLKFNQIYQLTNLGELYFGNLRYGNGTVLDILDSNWKASESGLLLDLGSHLVDLFYMLFGMHPQNLIINKTIRNESIFPDYMMLQNDKINIEIGYCFWKSDFRIELYFSEGSLHLLGLQKWGKSQLILRQRVKPSGVPKETIYNFEGPDLTWVNEHRFVEGLKMQGYVGVYGAAAETTQYIMNLVGAE